MFFYPFFFFFSYLFNSLVFTSMTGMESVHVSKHPLVAQKLSQLRENNLKPKVVRELTRDLSLLLGYEASSDITITKGHQVSKN